VLAFGWSWFWWLAAIPLSADQDKTLMMALTFMGGYGPAVSGILTLSLRDASRSWRWGRSNLCFTVAFAAILTVMVLRYLAGRMPHYDALPDHASLNAGTIVVIFLACLIGAWVISSARSMNPTVRERMASLLPLKLSTQWLGFALFFVAILMTLSWGIGHIVGLETSRPPLWGHSAPEAVCLFVLSFLMTTLVRGGMEEPGWRGFMLPELQKRFSPLVASLVIAAFWDLWHVPLHLNGFYPESVVQGMIGRSVYIIPLSILLTWFYNRTGGSLFLLICLHTTFNVMGDAVPASFPPAAILMLAFVFFIVFKDKMYRPLGPRPAEASI
jgi:membrane protease YdiL (CAAX protease family)